MNDDLLATLTRILRTPQDLADYLIEDFEAQTGMTATEEDRDYALQIIHERLNP